MYNDKVLSAASHKTPPPPPPHATVTATTTTNHNNNGRYLTRGMGKLCEGHVTDFYPWPTCEMHHSLVTEYTEFTAWIWEGMGYPHGPVHSWIGGLLNCEDVISTVSALVGQEAADALALYTFDQRKNLWLEGFFECKSNAANVGESVDEVCVSVVRQRERVRERERERDLTYIALRRWCIDLPSSTRQIRKRRIQQGRNGPRGSGSSCCGRAGNCENRQLRCLLAGLMFHVIQRTRISFRVSSHGANATN